MAAEKIDPSTPENEMLISRVFAAPPDLVWKVWTDPAHLSRWWGPQGFTTTTQALELRLGGVWRYTMHGPDGRNYENQITYLELVEPQRIVYKHGGDVDSEPVSFQVTVTFEPEGNNTRVTMRMVFPSKAARDHVVREYNAAEGQKQHMARLGEYLEQLGAAENAAAESIDAAFTMTRVFNAPRDQVWRAWTERDRLIGWFRPQEATLTRYSLDVRPGGEFHYCMRLPHGVLICGKWVFRDVVPAERLEFLVSYSDEAGGITCHPTNPDWPLETLAIVTLAEHAGKGRGTVLTLKMSSLYITDSERRAFEAGHDSLYQGWNATFNQLARHLAGA